MLGYGWRNIHKLYLDKSRFSDCLKIFCYQFYPPINPLSFYILINLFIFYASAYNLNKEINISFEQRFFLLITFNDSFKTIQHFLCNFLSRYLSFSTLIKPTISNFPSLAQTWHFNEAFLLIKKLKWCALAKTLGNLLFSRHRYTKQGRGRGNIIVGEGGG